jgi:hypothetical protein
MRFEGVNTRVVKSSAATEVFVTNESPYMNFAIHLPPDADIKSGDSIELVGPPDLQPAEVAPTGKASRLSTTAPPAQV